MHVYITILTGLNQLTAFEVNLLQCLLQCLNVLQIITVDPGTPQHLR